MATIHSYTSANRLSVGSSTNSLSCRQANMSSTALSYWSGEEEQQSHKEWWVLLEALLVFVQQEDGGSTTITNLLPDSRLTSPRAKLTSASFNLYSSPSCLQVVQTLHLQRTQLVIFCNSLLTNDTSQFQHLPCKFQVRLILLFILLSTFSTFSCT